MVDARELTHRFPGGHLWRGESAALSRFGPAVITVIGLLLAMAGAFAPREESGAAGSLATRLVVPLPDWLIIATVAALAAASLILIAIIFPKPRP